MKGWCPMRHLVTTALVLVLAISAAACAADTTPDIAQFDVAGANESTIALDERAAAPAGALPAFVVRSYADPAAFDELLAEAQAQAGVDQVIVTADLNGCILVTAWALPRPADVLVGYQFDPGIDCAQVIDYRVLFIIDMTGSNAEGDWDYRTTPPAVTIERQAS